ncbi:type II secretion system protein GspC [Halorhodospira halochloris]|uniref:type II secretion system protein GspC n=1 Tax=Halorhodospira halochloris TaxID=1052 RepID=UPI001EE7B67C|nr:type II secretion system protein GspC [Halorhodospira halochloris]MCG5529278.1 type II secretion system protein GspC [Halorhodospira halochloris]
MQTRIEQLKNLATPEKGGPWARRLGAMLLFIAIILIANSAAQTTWQFIEPMVQDDPSEGIPASSAASATAAREQQNGQIDQRSLSAIADYYLFGRPPEQREEQRREIPTDAPETRLDLSLKGILASGGEGQGAAIIDAGDGQKVFIAGAELPGDAVLERVQNDRVILSRDGNFEMLRLDRETLEIEEHAAPAMSSADLESSFVERGEGGRTTSEHIDYDDLSDYSPPDNGATADDRADESATDTDHVTATFERGEVESLRNELRDNPSKIADLIQIRPVLSGGSIRGFRISPRNERAEAYFERAGLRSNDLILEVNGVSAANHHEMQQMAEELENTSQVRLRIERNGTEQDLTLRID